VYSGFELRLIAIMCSAVESIYHTTTEGITDKYFKQGIHMELTQEQIEQLTEHLLDQGYISERSSAVPIIENVSETFLTQLLDDMTYVRPDEFLASLPVWVTEDDATTAG